VIDAKGDRLLWLGVTCALAAAGLYGLMPNFVRAAYNNGIPAVEATFFRTSILVIAFGAVVFLKRESLEFPRSAWPSLWAQALSTLMVSVCYLASVQFIPVGLAVVIFFSFPVFILLIAPVAEGHAPGLARILLALLAFAGLAIALGPSFTLLDWRGLALAFLASLGGVLQFFSGRAISRHLTPLAFGVIVHAAIWPFTLGVALAAGGGHLHFLSDASVTSTGLAYLAGVAAVYAIAYFLQMQSLRFARASDVAPYFNLEPVVTTAVAALLLGEVLELRQYVGGIMVLAALVAAGFLPKRMLGK
jgi:drug/metabolite transporter (DMT)-like permease